MIEKKVQNKPQKRIQKCFT